MKRQTNHTNTYIVYEKLPKNRIDIETNCQSLSARKPFLANKLNSREAVELLGCSTQIHYHRYILFYCVLWTTHHLIHTFHRYSTLPNIIRNLSMCIRIDSVHIVEAVEGTIGRLPCNITPSISDDKVILVLWYKDGHTLPIYR